MNTINLPLRGLFDPWQHGIMFKSRPRWIDEFTTTMSGFGIGVDSDHIVELAEVVYELHSDLDPAAVARSEIDKWPRDPFLLRSHDR